MDGEITIGTRLDTDKFDRQVTNLEKRIKKEEDKKIIIETKLSGQEEELEKARQKTDQLADAYQKLKAAQDALNTGKATPAQFTAFQDLQSTYGSLEQLGTQFDKALSKQDAIEQKVAQTKYRYDEINSKVSEYKQKIEGVKLQQQTAQVDKMKESFNKVGSSIEGSIKKAARLALGIFGIRSAYLALRRASNDLANYDKQYAANLEYIRYALTQAIAPILRYIVQLAATLLGYINAILQGWFGINLFANGSAESFKKMKAGASGASKAVKEIKKQLTGFDEINMLTDQSDTGTKSGAGGIASPDFDLSAIQGEPPAWLKWIIDHKDLILSILAGIAAAIVAIKLGLGGIKALGIGLLITGIVYAIQKVIKYLKDPSWKNFGGVIQGIGIAIVGLGVIIGSLPVAIAGAAVLILGTVTKYWDKIQKYLQNGIDWLSGKNDWVKTTFGKTIGDIYNMFVKNLQLILNWLNTTFTSIKAIFDGIIKFIKGVFKGDWKLAWEGIQQIFTNVWKVIKTTWTTVFNLIKNGVVTMGKTVGNIISGAFKLAVNAVLSAIERVLNKPISTINSLIDNVNSLPGVNISKLSTFSLPRLAVGGIVNMPNKGTLVGGAIAGESGREGVIPLTDSQAMSELGREIGKNVLVNLTNITSMNGRVISRELKQVQSEQEFAFNQ